MKKIITAMANDTLNNELKKYNKYDVLREDLYYQDAVFDILNIEKIDILIVSALLQGQLEFCEFVEKIRKIDKLMRIIVITDSSTTEFREKLNSNDITDIFIDSEINVDDVLDSIDREEPIRKKYELINETTKLSYIADKNEDIPYKRQRKETNYNSITQKQEVIAVTGTNGSGKSTVISNFARILSNKTDSRVLLIDLDTLNGNIDEILEINKIPPNVEILMDENKKCGLNYAVELISKNRFDTNVFAELVINVGGFDVLTGNTSLHYCQNVLSIEYYDKVLNAAKEKYDFIIIDTSSNIFLDSTKWAMQNANKIFFVTENNYISMKKSIQLIDVLVNNWKIWKDKISVIINKLNINGIEKEVVKKILKDYEIIGKIKYGEENIESSYTRILETINYIPKVSFFERLFENKHTEIFNSNRLPIKNINNKGVRFNAN